MDCIDELLTRLHPVSARRLVPHPAGTPLPSYKCEMSPAPEGMRWETDAELWERVAAVADATARA